MKLIAGHDLSPFTVLIGMLAILLVLGCFVDQVSMMLLTPPFGLLVFTMKSVVPPEITLSQVFAAVTPYVLIGLAMMIAILFFPGIATWLPRVLG